MIHMIVTFGCCSGVFDVSVLPCLVEERVAGGKGVEVAYAIFQEVLATLKCFQDFGGLPAKPVPDLRRTRR